MRKLLGPTLLAVFLTASLAASPGASAATEVGNLCEAKKVSAEEVTAVQLSRESSSGLPPTAPTAGVVTSWRVNATFTKEQFPQRLEVLRGAGPAQFTVVGQSDVATASGGINVFKTRIPVEAGDRFGVAGRALFCETSLSGDVVGTAPGSAAPARARSSPTRAANGCSRCRRASSPTPTGTATATRPRTSARPAPPGRRPARR